MSRTCTICNHSSLEGIDKALVAGEPYRNIAKQFETSYQAVYRHQKEHLPAILVGGEKAREEAHGLDVVQQLRDINATTTSILNEARKSGQPELALKAIDRIQKQVEMQARLLGDLQDGNTVNVLLAPEWVSLRSMILVALVPYPEARQAVVGALNGHAG